MSSKATRLTVPIVDSVFAWIKGGLGWRLRVIKRHLSRAIGVREIQWARVVMNRETEALIRSTVYSNCSALEISGNKWNAFGFKTYQSAGFPDYDVCEKPLKLDEYDIIIAEQVLEHVLWPYRAVTNVYRMLRPGGKFLVTTPFLLRVHNYPVDVSRWTELGLKHLLAECGFDYSSIQTGSWGNRACVRANFRVWRSYIPWLHSLKNEPDYPVVVWAWASKPGSFCGNRENLL